MGRTGSSLEGSFPPQGGGRTPRQLDPHIGEKRGGSWVKWLLLFVMVGPVGFECVVVLLCCCVVAWLRFLLQLWVFANLFRPP